MTEPMCETSVGRQRTETNCDFDEILFSIMMNSKKDTRRKNCLPTKLLVVVTFSLLYFVLSPWTCCVLSTPGGPLSNWCDESFITCWCGNSDPPVGVVNLAPPVRVVNLASPVGVVNLAPPVRVVNLALPVGVVNLAPPV